MRARPVPTMNTTTHSPPANLLLLLVRRTLLLALLWSMLAEAGPWADWPLVAGIIGAALTTSLLFRPAESARLRGFAVLRFVPWFLAQSLAGGLDVSRRALSPGMPLRPGFIHLPLGLPAGLPQVAFVWIVSLLPGTAGVHLRDNTLEVHVLDRDLHTAEKLRALEQRVSGFFFAP
jgi:multicomponent Na+:H+ antiporter subunit E